MYFDSLGIEYISQGLLNKIRDKATTQNMHIIQDEDSITYRFYFIAFIEYMIAENTLLDYTNLFSFNNYKKNCKIIYK